MISGSLSTTEAMASREPMKSEVSTSTEQSATRALIARTVAAMRKAPPSGRSSLLTMVTWACLRPMRITEAATFIGSSLSTASGSPVPTAQNRQRRVPVPPRILKLAVPCVAQHSWRLGQRASSQTVCNPSVFTSFLMAT